MCYLFVYVVGGLLSALELALQVCNIASYVAVCIYKVRNSAAGVENGGVVLSSHLAAYGCKGGLGKVAHQVHRNLAGLDNLPLAGLGNDGFRRNLEIIAHRVADSL